MASIYTLLVSCAYASVKDMHPEDRSLVGRYEIEVIDDHAPEADIVEAVLDAFHNNFGVEEVDGIDCQVVDPNGKEIYQDDGDGSNVETDDPEWVAPLPRAKKRKLPTG